MPLRPLVPQSKNTLVHLERLGHCLQQQAEHFVEFQRCRHGLTCLVDEHQFVGAAGTSQEARVFQGHRCLVGKSHDGRAVLCRDQGRKNRQPANGLVAHKHRCDDSAGMAQNMGDEIYFVRWQRDGDNLSDERLNVLNKDGLPLVPRLLVGWCTRQIQWPVSRLRI